MITSDHSGFAGVQPPEINSPPANIRSPELGYPAQLCLSMSARSIGADDHLRAEPLLPEVNTQKDHHLPPRRLRRSTATCNASTSGQNPSRRRCVIWHVAGGTLLRRVFEYHSIKNPQRESHQGSVMPLIIQFRHLIASICACFVAASASAYLLSSVWIWLISQMLSISGKYVISSATSLNRTFRFMTFTSGEWTNIFFNSQRSLKMM